MQDIVERIEHAELDEHSDDIPQGVTKLEWNIYRKVARRVAADNREWSGDLLEISIAFEENLERPVPHRKLPKFLNEEDGPSAW